MSAVTYSDAQVIDTINTRFVPVQVNTQEAAGLPMVQRFYQVWTPDLRLVTPTGVDLYHWNGYLPPAEFLPQLLVAQAQALLRLHDEPGAATVYREVLERFPTSAWHLRHSTSLPWRHTSTVIRRPICWTPGAGSRRSTRTASGG